MHHCIPGSFFQKTFGESYLFFFFFFGILFSSKISKCSARLLAERVFSLMYSDSVFACQEESESKRRGEEAEDGSGCDAGASVRVERRRGRGQSSAFSVARCGLDSHETF